MTGETIGDGPFQGIVTPCDVCLGVGELVTLAGLQVLRAGDCPRCEGTGHIHIRCSAEDVEDVERLLPPTRQQLQVRSLPAGTGLCTACFGGESLASVDCDEDGVPVRYLEAVCPRCAA